MLTTILQVLGIAIVLVMVISLFVGLYIAGIALILHIKDYRRETYLSRKLFERIQEYRNDFS